jgi:hypothetical protein
MVAVSWIWSSESSLSAKRPEGDRNNNNKEKGKRRKGEEIFEIFFIIL